jgi:altronate dehydratase small subunit
MTTLETRAMVINEEDNVATVIGTAQRGDELPVTGAPGIDTITVASDDVPFGHKVALVDISPGDEITKYGYSIGKATEDIKVGERVHIHNMESNRGHGERAGEGQ